MSAIIEPTGATWHVSPTMWKSVSVVANSEDRNVCGCPRPSMGGS